MSSARLKSLSLFLVTALVTQLAKLFRQAAGVSEAVLAFEAAQVQCCRVVPRQCWLRLWLQVFNF